MGSRPKVDGYKWRASRNEVLRHLQEIAAAVTAAKRSPRETEMKLSEISASVAMAVIEVVRMSEIATAEVGQLRGRE